MTQKETKIYLIRHGQSLANAAKIYIGHTDIDLSEEGYAQAERTAEYLSEVKAVAVYSSDLIRAYNTALPHAKLRGLSVVTSPALREVYFGDWEGVAISELETRREFLIDWRQNFGTCQVPGGEYVPDVARRAYDEVLRLAKAHPGEEIIIAMHSGPIRALWGIAAEIPMGELAARYPFPPNASVSTLLCDGERLFPLDYGITDHLK